MAIQPKNDTAIKVDTISEKTGSAGVSIGSTLKVDTIEDGTGASGVTIEDTLKVDTIAEDTAAAGVTIDSLLIKDGGMPDYIDETSAFANAPLVWDGTDKWEVGGSPTDYSGSISLSATSPLTVSGSTVDYAEWVQIGKMVTVFVDLNWTLGGSAGSQVAFTLPSTPKSTSYVGSFGYSNNSAKGVCRAISVNGTMFLQRESGNSWATGTVGVVGVVHYLVS